MNRIHSVPVRNYRIVVSIALVLMPVAATAYDPMECGDLSNAFGPYDYRTMPPDKRQLVESAHFTGPVERLEHGISGTIAGEIDYTLRAIPNNPRALDAMGRLTIKLKNDKPYGMHWPVSCYFERAKEFAPDDGNVFLVHGLYFFRKGDLAQARRELETAKDLSPNSANVRYNLGLVYFGLKDYDKASEEAKEAYAQGYPLPGLREKLKSIGRWN